LEIRQLNKGFTDLHKSLCRKQIETRSKNLVKFKQEWLLKDAKNNQLMLILGSVLNQIWKFNQQEDFENFKRTIEKLKNGMLCSEIYDYEKVEIKTIEDANNKWIKIKENEKAMNNNLNNLFEVEVKKCLKKLSNKNNKVDSLEVKKSEKKSLGKIGMILIGAYV
jgi:uncharacterized protein YabN with tetrapyrrole methylase and pyrophosphatase domain